MDNQSTTQKNMREEWLNRIALTWANKTRPRQVRALLDRYGSATEVVARFGEMVNREAKELSFPKISRQFFDYIPTLVDIYSRYVDIFLS